MARLLLALLAAGAAATGGALAGPSMSQGWDEITISHADCLLKAEKIMRAAGLTKNFEITGETVWGEKGDYTAAVRCVEAKKIIIRTVAGPSATETSQISLKLKEDFFK